MKLVEVKVVGMHFRGADAVQLAESLTAGEPLTLEREADNPHDINAVKVFYQDTWLGYIERGQAAWIAGELDDDPNNYVCTVTGHEAVTNARGKENVYPVVEIHIGE